MCVCVCVCVASVCVCVPVCERECVCVHVCVCVCVCVCVYKYMQPLSASYCQYTRWTVISEDNAQREHLHVLETGLFFRVRFRSIYLSIYLHLSNYIRLFAAYGSNLLAVITCSTCSIFRRLAPNRLIAKALHVCVCVCVCVCACE